MVRGGIVLAGKLFKNQAFFLLLLANTNIHTITVT
jgi:hypothetical protein